MANLSDHIEQHLKKLLALSARSYVDIQRHELAGKFECVPSQINYVLASRFSLDRGYLVESRRGGGGYIRIFRIHPLQVKPWKELFEEIASGDFEPPRAARLIQLGCEDNIISRREARMVEVLLSDDIYLEMGCERKQARQLQKKLLKAALEAILKENY